MARLPLGRQEQGNHKGCPYGRTGQPQGLPLHLVLPRDRATTRVAPTGGQGDHQGMHPASGPRWATGRRQGNHKGCPYMDSATTRVATVDRATTRVAPTSRLDHGTGQPQGLPLQVDGRPQGLPLQANRATTRVAPTSRRATEQGNHKGCPYRRTGRPPRCIPPGRRCSGRRTGRPQGLPHRRQPDEVRWTQLAVVRYGHERRHEGDHRHDHRHWTGGRRSAVDADRQRRLPHRRCARRPFGPDRRQNTRVDACPTCEKCATTREMRASMERFDGRLDAVEVAFGKVDQRLLTIERVVIPSPAPEE